ncbi:MAG: ComEC/Rec2 family competence protein [Bacteroidota bacterium]
MPPYAIHFWKKNPFIRLLLPLMAGIILQWNLSINEKILWCTFLASAIAVIIFFFMPVFKRFSLSVLQGFATAFLFFCFGSLLTEFKDIRNNDLWFGNLYNAKDQLIVSLDEPIIEKTKSFKANATVSYLLNEKASVPAKGKIILYFKKDSSLSRLAYGTQLIIKSPLQEIKNAGNPGGFDYKRYSLFHGITHQVFLKKGDYSILEEKKEKWLDKFLLGIRERVLIILRNNIKSKKELGLAEALLIGYKDDLEQTLVQSYTNTGVVHIIAISGLHLGLIYWLLVRLFSPLQKRKSLRWLRPIFILTGLWLFSLLAGGQASVLRSAVMFSCIIIGTSLSKKTSIYNTMALSAFILLCYNPFWLWDVGFQLSYAAVLSIIIFMRPVYNLFYTSNKIIDFFWKLNAVTIAAQILTVPLSIYHFHQFPNYFILTNFIAVPLSSMIVLGEILLCAISFIPVIASLVGKLLTLMIGFMNSYIERIETLPFSLWDGLQFSIIQVILLFLFVAFSSFWLLERSKFALKMGLIAFTGFAIGRSLSFINTFRQKEIIVYNVPQRQAIDFVAGKNYLFVGDKDLLADDFARNFHLKPSRTKNRVSATTASKNICGYNCFKSYFGKHILLIDEPVSFKKQTNKPTIDLLVLSKNPKIFIPRLASAFTIKQVIFDGSNPEWKLGYWKRDCDSLRIPYHAVTEKGAFVMNLN